MDQILLFDQQLVFQFLDQSLARVSFSLPQSVLVVINEDILPVDRFRASLELLRKLLRIHTLGLELHLKSILVGQKHLILPFQLLNHLLLLLPNLLHLPNLFNQLVEFLLLRIGACGLFLSHFLVFIGFKLDGSTKLPVLGGVHLPPLGLGLARGALGGRVHAPVPLPLDVSGEPLLPLFPGSHHGVVGWGLARDAFVDFALQILLGLLHKSLQSLLVLLKLSLVDLDVLVLIVHGPLQPLHRKEEPLHLQTQLIDLPFHFLVFLLETLEKRVLLIAPLDLLLVISEGEALLFELLDLPLEVFVLLAQLERARATLPAPVLAHLRWWDGSFHPLRRRVHLLHYLLFG
mmetsp:Transcript_9524/g.9098  ORF Transcript_9524/g.9098 Transcript_9524/m.9098 type:complete len:347 (-) Transcript_9524:361-1401(-)